MNVAHGHFSVGCLCVHGAADGVQFDVAERIADGYRTARGRGALHPAVVGRAIHAAVYVGKRDVAEAIGDVRSPADGGELHITVVVAEREVAADVASIHAAEGGRNARGSGVGQRDRAVASGDGHRALSVSRGDTAETVAHFERALYVGCLHRAVVVIDGDISPSAMEFDASEGIVQMRRASVPHRERAVAVLDVRGAVDSGHVDAAETVPDRERSVGGHADVVAYRPGRTLAGTKPSVFFFGINGLDAHAFARLLHFNLDFLREGFGFFAGAGLRANGGGDFDVAAGFAMKLHFPELVLNADGLAGAQRHGLLKILGNLLLTRIGRPRGFPREQEQRGEHSRNRCETQQSSPMKGRGGNHGFLASKTSSSVRCFSWYMASIW